MMRSDNLPALAASLLALASLMAAAPARGATASPGNGEPVAKVRKNGNPRPQGWIASDQAAAVALSHETPAPVHEVLQEDLPLRQQRLRRLGLGPKDIEHSYLWLQSPFVNTFEDEYEPVRFMHSKHAAALHGDCATCHHYRPLDPEASETVACKACHRHAFDPELPGRIGLKAAYHMQCLGCHEQMNEGPVSCNAGCHEKKVPDHRSLVSLSDDPTPTEVTEECLRCHEQAGEEMLASAHWLWRGPSSYTVEHRSSICCGKCSTVLNNY
jgi:hypothetical protein